MTTDGLAYIAVKATLTGNPDNYDWDFRNTGAVTNRADCHRRGLAMNHGDDDFSIVVLHRGMLVQMLDAYYRVSFDWTEPMMRKFADKLHVAIKPIGELSPEDWANVQAIITKAAA